MKKKLFIFFFLLLFFTGCFQEMEETINTSRHDKTYKGEDYNLPEKIYESNTFFSTSPKKSIINNEEEFGEIIHSILLNYNTVGASIAVFSGNDVIYTYTYGYADKENEILVSDDTKYRSASISKVVTALCAMMLYEGGKLDLDASISEVIGINLDENPNNKNTSRHLLTHTSTITDHYVYENAFDVTPPLSLEEMAISHKIHSSDMPGKRYEYSNFAAGLISAVIESVTQERFYQYADNEIFKTLKIDGGYFRTLINDKNSIANIYSNGVLSCDVKNWGRTDKLYNQIPLGQQYAIGQCELIISAKDLAKIGIILAGDGRYNGVRFLNEQTLDEMFYPYITVYENEYATHHGMGVRLSDDIVKGRRIIGHPGQAYGMIGGLYFDALDSSGVVILTNGCDVTRMDNGMYGINHDIVNAVYENIIIL